MRPLTVIVILLLSIQSSAQVLFNLEQLAGPGNDYIYTSAVDSKGNTYLALSLGWSTGSSTEIYRIFGKEYNRSQVPNWIKLDKNGNIVWMKTFEAPIQAISFDKDDNLYVAATPSYSLVIAKVSPDGNVIWRNSEGTSGGFSGLAILADAEGNTYTTGSVSSWSVYGLTLNERSCCGAHDFLVKFDSQGNRKWVIASAPNNYTYGRKLAFDLSGNIMLAGGYMYNMRLGPFSFGHGIGYNNVYLARIAAESGAVLWAQGYGGGSGHISLQDMKVDTDGSLYITGGFSGAATFGTQSYQSQGDYDFFLTRLNSDGVVQWFRHEGRTGVDHGESIELSGSDLYVAGVFSGNVSLDQAQLGYIIGPTTFVSRFNKSGKASWIKGYSSLSSESYAVYNSVVRLHEIQPRQLRIFGAFNGAMSGYDNSFSSSSRDLFAGEILDTLHTQPGAMLRGKSFIAVGGNCDPSQSGLKNVIIAAEPGPVYALSDASGNFQMRLPAGSYAVRQILPQKRGLDIAQTCPPGQQQVVINSLDDVPPAINFGNTLEEKPYLEVDVAGVFRRCFSNDLVVQFCNEGLADASGIEVKVNLPEFVIPLSSSMPWKSKIDNQLIFSFAALTAGECQRIVIRDSVICGDESIRGLTQCVTATITPGNAEETNPLWDGSLIEAAAFCLENGFIRLVLKNAGAGGMRDSADFHIYANDVLAITHKYKLPADDSLVMQIPANGKTIRLEAYSTEHSPRASVSVAIEGCSTSNEVTISKGFVNAFAQSDEQAELETFCGIIADSFDPNDKQVVPAGVTSEHRIHGTEELEYLIRFQNTGTAEAHNVVIRDVLDEGLDLSTLETGVASHPFTFQVEGTGRPELVWRFKNIMLPDSTTNEPGSHGFVKFKIKPLPGLPAETVIRNRANIYFDFNSPVTTNEVFHTIGMPPAIAIQNEIVLQNCDERVAVNAGSDIDLSICDDPSVTIDSQPARKAYSLWTVLSGTASVQTRPDGSLNIDQLAEGVNTLRHVVKHCDNADTSMVTVERVMTPEAPIVPDHLALCSNDISQYSVIASGEYVTWYSDEELKEKVLEGGVYFPRESRRLFVTAQRQGCVSQPSTVEIEVLPSPPPPVAPSLVNACSNTATLLTAQGTDLLWYHDLNSGEPSATGERYQTTFTSAGVHEVFVSQVLDGCESEKRVIAVDVTDYNMGDVMVMNFITPNGDHANESFFIAESKATPCLGEFRNVVIYNRFGKPVFSSRDPDFRWAANGVDTGVYFYSVTFAREKFQGTITVSR